MSETAKIEDGTRKVTVCDKCLRASCWHGIFMCDEAFGAGIVEKTVAELDALHREHPCYYSIEHLREQGIVA